MPSTRHLSDERKTVLLIRHNDDPRDDRVQTWLDANGFSVHAPRLFAGEAAGPIGADVAGAVIMGGKFNAFSGEPFMLEEARLIEKMLARGLPLLGICQGAQQIAHVLGAAVGPLESGDTEFGYYEVTPTPQAAGFLDAPMVFAQAHFHTFGIPSGAQRLASSALAENRAFRIGQAIALQFHPEVTMTGFRRWQNAPWARYGEPGAQARGEQDRLMAAHDGAQDAWFNGLMARMFHS